MLNSQIGVRRRYRLRGGGEAWVLQIRRRPGQHIAEAEASWAETRPGSPTRTRTGPLRELALQAEADVTPDPPPEAA